MTSLRRSDALRQNLLGNCATWASL